MSTSVLRLSSSTLPDRLAARLGRALVRWADSRAVIKQERRLVAFENDRALAERERAATLNRWLHG